MKLYAISDLHLTRAANWQALLALPAYPDDWLIVAGDLSSHLGRFRAGLQQLTGRFARVLWTPGNHDLWTHPDEGDSLRGVFKYNQMVAVCRELGVLTPEDPFVCWPGSAGPVHLALTFTLYDYSFRPDDVPADRAVAWALATRVLCNDEFLLHPDPFPSREEWCAARCRYTEARLARAADAGPLLLINHYPLHRSLARLPRIPRFSIWSGTRRTEAWHTRYPVRAAVYGHLHIRNQTLLDGVPFSEVSLGYPDQWQAERGIAGYLRLLDDAA